MSEHEGVPLASAIQRGVGWKLGSQAFTQIARVLSALALARLLTPHEYGLAGMALVFSGLVLAFADLGLGAALVQRRDLTERDRSTVFWMSVASGAVLTLVGVALAGPLASLFGESEVRALVATMSLTFLLTSLGTTQRSLLARDLDFRRLELRVMVSVVAGGGVGVALAAAGLGPWAIVGQAVTVSFVSTAALWLVSAWRPQLVFSLASLRSLGVFSGQVFGERFLYYSTESVTNALVGRSLGAASLGTFTIANNVVLLPFSRIAIPIGEVLFPAFSRIQDERERVASMWLRAVPLLSALCLPALAGLIVLAPDFVPVVLGAQWRDAVPVLQILCWVGIVNTLRAWNVGILMSLGRGDLILRFGAIFLGAYVIATIVGVNWGVVGTAIGFAVAATTVEVPYLWVTARELGVSFGAVLRVLSGVVQATLVMTVVIVVGRLAMVESGLGPELRLVAGCALGLTALVLALAWRAPTVVDELRVQVRGRRRPGVPATARPAER
jgi:O-antigen/teichoic acid export membrane protein